jgi:glycosyltransferase involved in cell wall biosynthesis
MARLDQRGISQQTREMVEHLNPAKVLAVLVNDPGWPEETGRFGKRDVTFVDSNLSQNLNKRVLDERKCRSFLEGLDVVMGVETFYDWSFCDWAREAGAKTILQSNPEFTAHHNNPSWPQPDRWVFPTPWMIDELEALGYGSDILPVPTVERDQTAADPDDEVMRILHVVGKAAAHDRNGTLEFIEAVAGLRYRTHVTLVTQEQDLPRRIRPGRNVTLDVVTGGVESRWDLYANQHMLVLPRKYGGLSLPTLEAMACGLTVLMPDCSPNFIWPGPRVTARKGRVFRSPFGKVQTFAVHPLDLISTIDRLAQKRDRLRDEMDEAVSFAAYNTWAEVAPRLYDPLLEEMS